MVMRGAWIRYQIWTAMSQNGPNHLGMCLITSGFVGLDQLALAVPGRAGDPLAAADGDAGAAGPKR